MREAVMQLSFVPEIRVCEWCTGPIQPRARKDSVTCSQECRQARHRFRITPATATAETPMRFSYLDPPYPTLARKYYKDQPTFAGEVDHAELIERAEREYSDGWALSTSAAALPAVLRLCPTDVRVAIWIRGSRSCVSHRARSAYEPVILRGGRARRMEIDEALDDVLLWGGRQPSHPGALPGMKSAAFCEWLFRQLGAMRGDDLADLFPGSGAVSRAWRLYSGQPVVASTGDAWNPPRIVPRRDSTLPSRLEESRAARRDG
jgi:hypothetical protein